MATATSTLDHQHDLRDRTTYGPGGTVTLLSCRTCGYAERRTYHGGLVRLQVRLRASWPWVNPVELLAVPYIVCPRCEGQKYDRGSCNLCGNLGVLDELGDRVR